MDLRRRASRDTRECCVGVPQTTARLVAHRAIPRPRWDTRGPTGHDCSSGGNRVGI